MENITTSTRLKIRIKDIAKRAQVSVGTVDRVLHNRGEVSEETRTLVNNIINELEYKPNLIASSLASKKPFQIGVLLPQTNDADSLWNYYSKGINNAMSEIGYFGGAVKKYFFDLSNETSYKEKVSLMLEEQVDAVIMVPMFGETSKKVSEELQTRNIPHVYLEEDGDNCVCQTGYVAAKLLTYGLSKETTVLIINIATDTYTTAQSQNRMKGFKAYLSENNITETKVRTINVNSCDEHEIKKTLTSAFMDYSFVRGLYVTGSDVHRVARFIDEKKLGNIRIIGYDALEQNISYLKKGTIDFLLSKNPVLQGYRKVKSLFYQLALRQNDIQPNAVSIDILTKENIDCYRF